MQFAIKEGQTIFDAVLAAYGSMDLTYKLLSENGLSLNDTLISGQKIAFEKTTPTSPEVHSSAALDENTRRQVRARNGQSLFDICMNTYGSLERIYRLIQDNEVVNINTSTLIDKMFIFDSTLIEDSIIFSHNTRENIIYNTLEGARIGNSYNISFNLSFD